MKILGIKVTHDSGMALIEDGKLIFCTEFEKVNNSPRYTKLPDISFINQVAKSEGLDIRSCEIVVDGWKTNEAKGDNVSLPAASYRGLDIPGCQSNLSWRDFTHASLGSYVSYPHMLGHIIGAYVASPFAEGHEPAYVISADGGQAPELHLVNPKSEFRVKYIDRLNEMSGVTYAIMGAFFGPYKNSAAEECIRDPKSIYPLIPYDIPGKLMSYIALGEVKEAYVYALHQLYADEISCMPVPEFQSRGPSVEMNVIYKFKQWVAEQGDYKDEDCLASIHKFLEEILVNGIIENVPKGSNLIFTGGSALNIKWNSAIRSTQGYEKLWVPPFPNDSGNALGAAACHMALKYDHWHLDWSVYSGPEFIMDQEPTGWKKAPINPAGIAAEIYTYPHEPVILIHGRAEIGPRALGHRSMLMDPRYIENKDILNKVKKREGFRPVAPICLEEEAPWIFKPGTKDPYMLFDHVVREPWNKKVPAIVHLDNTARLQTVGEDGCPYVREILQEYKMSSGIGMLCNTSANDNGKGFFGIASVTFDWAEKNGVNKIVINGNLYTKEN